MWPPPVARDRDSDLKKERIHQTPLGGDDDDDEEEEIMKEKKTCKHPRQSAVAFVFAID